MNSADESSLGSFFQEVKFRSWLKPPQNPHWSGMFTAWEFHHEWTFPSRKSGCLKLRLQPLWLGAVRSCVVLGEGQVFGLEYPDGQCAFAYLLNLSDPMVWDAIASWEKSKHIAGNGGLSYTPLSFSAHGLAQVIEFIELEGDEAASNQFASAVANLIQTGQLENELARQLEVNVPLHCVVVETPMTCESLRPFARPQPVPSEL